MAAIDKLYDKENKVVLRLDVYTDEEVISFKKQIEMYLGEYEE